jgi:putative transposase
VLQVSSETGNSELESLSEKITSETNCKVKAFERITWENSSGVLAEDLHNTFNMVVGDCELSKENSEKVVSALSTDEFISFAKAEMAMKTNKVIEIQEKLKYIKRLKELEAENSRLKKMYADERLMSQIRLEALEGKF